MVTFLVKALGSVPNWGASAGRSTGLLMSDGTDSVLRILATRGRNGGTDFSAMKGKHLWYRYVNHMEITEKDLEGDVLGRKVIRHEGASFVHLL